MTRILCDIYRSPKKEGLYLYVPQSTGLQGLPAELLSLFGKPERTLTLLLSETRQLARADITKVLQGIADQGFYLQLPPAAENYMTDINRHNDKLVGG